METETETRAETINSSKVANPTNNKELALKILQEKTSYAWEGGGVLGVAHAGALVRLYEFGGLNKKKFVVGSSVGSIISMALACGATSHYIKTKVLELNPNRFNDGGNIISRFFRLIFRSGLHKGDQIEVFAGEVLNDLTGNSNITFSEAYDKYGVYLTVPLSFNSV